MSEYQYYEFAAIDGPISDEGLRYARGCSSRANVSRVRWQNTYTFGDFHGSVDTLLKYYDAHFYIANWGTVRLGLAFPKGAIAPEAIQPYLRGGERYEDTLTVKEIGNRCIVWWERNEEGGWGWTEGEGLIDQLIGVREELMRGDYRALFLGWLADFDPEEWRDPEDGAVEELLEDDAVLDLDQPHRQARLARIEEAPVDRRDGADLPGQLADGRHCVEAAVGDHRHQGVARQGLDLDRVDVHPAPAGLDEVLDVLHALGGAGVLLAGDLPAEVFGRPGGHDE